MTNNDTIFYAPIEIESAEDLKFFGITRKDCCTWRVGITPVLVYLMPSNEETRDYLVQELKRKYTKRTREYRCQVPGKQKAWITCPESNHCSSCPYGSDGTRRQGRCVSLDALLEEGYDCAAPDFTEERVGNRAELEDLLALLREVNPDYVKIVELLAAGFSVAEIATSLHTNVSSVYRSLKKIRTLAKEYRDE